MSRKQIFLIAFILIALGITAYFFFGRGKKPVEIENTAIVTPTPTPTPVNFLIWVDEAGFSFKYPEGTTIDKHSEDTVNYANLTLTLPSSEVVNIKMSDNTFKTLDKWVGDRSALDTTLEGRPAKRVIEGDLETLACIDNEVVITITGKDIATIVDSWTFIYPSPTAAKKPAVVTADDSDVLEEL